MFKGIISAAALASVLLSFSISSYAAVDSDFNDLVGASVVGAPVAFDTPLSIINPNNPSEIIEIEPNWFKVGFDIANKSNFDVVIVTVKYECTYDSADGNQKRVDFANFPFIGQDYLEVIPAGSNGRLLNLLVDGLGQDNPSLRYEVKATLGGLYSPSGRSEEPVRRFEKVVYLLLTR